MTESVFNKIDMSKMHIAQIQNYAADIIAQSGSDAVTVYLLENSHRTPSSYDINRTVGAPVGISDEIWPRYKGKKMAHVITVDISAAPEVKAKLPNIGKGEIRAIAVFVSSLLENQVFTPGTDESAVVFLTAQDLVRGVSDWQPPKEEEEFDFESTTFTLHEVTLPTAVFDDAIYERCDHDPLVVLHEALCGFAMLGGKPIWLQHPEHDGDILLQFDESLVDMNLGDAGVMYVFKDTAFWQCH